MSKRNLKKLCFIFYFKSTRKGKNIERNRCMSEYVNPKLRFFREHFSKMKVQNSPGSSYKILNFRQASRRYGWCVSHSLSRKRLDGITWSLRYFESQSKAIRTEASFHLDKVNVSFLCSPNYYFALTARSRMVWINNSLQRFLKIAIFLKIFSFSEIQARSCTFSTLK